jgi:hypothetical protein
MHPIGTAAEPSSELSAEKSARELLCTVPTGRPRFGHPIGNPQIHHMFDRFELIYSGNIARDVCLTYVVCPEGKRGVTKHSGHANRQNIVHLPTVSTLGTPHKNLFQFKQSKHFH